MKTKIVSPDPFIDVIKSSIDDGSLSIFCGAGISIPSGIPSVLPLVQKLLSLLNCSEKDIQNFLKDGELPIPFESIIQDLKENLTFENGNQFLSEFTKLFHAKPNQTHFLLANLLHRKLVKNVITTNFDTCIEKAYRQASGSNLERLIVYAESEEQLDHIDLDYKIIKLHGCASKPSTLGTTVDQITKTEFFLKNKRIVERILNSSSCILFLGYSCSDKWDITRIFNETNRSTHKLPSLIFLQHVDEKIKKPTKAQQNLFSGYNASWSTCYTNFVIRKLGIDYRVKLPEFKFSPAKFLAKNLKPVHEDYVSGKLFQAGGLDLLADKYLEKSLRLFEARKSPKDLINTLESLADIARRLNRSEFVEKYFRDCIEALPKYDQIGKRAKDFLEARLYRKFGAFLVVNQRTDEGKVFLKQAVELMKPYNRVRLKVDDMFQKAEIYNDYGFLLYDEDDRELAEEYWLMALKIHEELSNTYPQRYLGAYCVALGNLSAKYYMADEYDKAITFCKKSLRLTEELATVNPVAYNFDVGRRLNNLGCYYRDAGDRKNALKYLNKALKLRKRLAKQWPEIYSPQIAFTFINLAVVYFKEPQNKIEALAYIDQAISIMKRFRHVESVSKYFNNLAKVLGKWGIDADAYISERLK